ncbi:MAG: molybdenum cofactor guanylyltransferase [Actinomycetota bacterium]
MPPVLDTTGVVLAGGRSTRFGSDKLVATYRGMPLLHHAVLRLIEVCSEVVVVLAPEGADPTLPPGIPARFARDATEGQGPLAGVLAGLQATTTDVALVVGGDMPEISTPVVLEMLEVAAQSSVDAVVLGDGDTFRPLPVLVRADRGREVAHALLHDEERRLRAFVQALRVAVIDAETWRLLDPAGATLRDIDTPGDLG